MSELLSTRIDDDFNLVDDCPYDTGNKIASNMCMRCRSCVKVVSNNSIRCSFNDNDEIETEEAKEEVINTPEITEHDLAGIEEDEMTNAQWVRANT